MTVQKFSRQRQLIKEVLITRKDHPTADIVYQNVRMQNPNISLGTVYRNLTRLAENGEIIRLNVGDGSDHFDADISPHYHFVCCACGSVTDLDADPDQIDALNALAAEGFEGHVAGHITYFYGTCQNCTCSC